MVRVSLEQSEREVEAAEPARGSSVTAADRHGKWRPPKGA
jgi:hypothetical protein